MSSKADIGFVAMGTLLSAPPMRLHSTAEVLSIIPIADQLIKTSLESGFYATGIDGGCTILTSTTRHRVGLFG
jgi:hypothetical protein